jgi:hypothetical protein
VSDNDRHAEWDAQNVPRGSHRFVAEWNADVLNMPLTGQDPGPRGYVRVPTTEELPTLMRMFDGFAPEPPDAWDETTDTRRLYELSIGFDADTDLEADLSVEAIRAFITRRLDLRGLVLVIHNNRGDQ